ncbi:hypothetical protein K443DRAFT_11139 [Laccaria amethystina LaAM-08-1]|uniref:Uncharacterized protein n=1 Tax=Laccaria amethystina LaAM-08-1 TaxID=1095629 RepID=A0A0C9WUA6_9AGAR|nr:hypothetical protein K443DRAFT_11139 [Laccaria amethystina LaAM-08-1]
MVSSFLPKRTVCLRPLDGLLSRWPLSLDELDEQPPSSLDGQPLDGQPNDPSLSRWTISPIPQRTDFPLSLDRRISLPPDGRMVPSLPQ